MSRKGASSKDLFGEVENMRIAESGSRMIIPGCSDEAQTGTEINFKWEFCGQINNKIYRAALRGYENSGFREILTEEKITEWSVESFGPDEHHALEMNYVISPESGELFDEQSDDDYLFEDISETDFLDVEALDVNDARSETSIAASLNSLACDKVTTIASIFSVGVKASRNDMLGAWGLMELKTGDLDQKFCSALHVADETQMSATVHC